jgi:hypothetical protein
MLSSTFVRAELIQKKSLSLEDARKVVAAAVAEAKKGVGTAAIAVVVDGGNLLSSNFGASLTGSSAVTVPEPAFFRSSSRDGDETSAAAPSILRTRRRGISGRTKKRRRDDPNVTTTPYPARFRFAGFRIDSNSVKDVGSFDHPPRFEISYWLLLAPVAAPFCV